ncbi:unnamed protein product, partial [Timema podura]|nr:unnamed protein product [Timema podura]
MLQLASWSSGWSAPLATNDLKIRGLDSRHTIALKLCEITFVLRMKDNIESLSLLLTSTKDELLKLQKEHTELLDNIQANEGSSTALQQLNQMNELSFQIENLHLQHTEKDLEIDSLKKILQEKTEKLAETANTIHGLEKNTSELEKLVSHWKEKAYLAQNSLLSNEKNMMEFKTNLEVEMSDLSIDCNTKVSELSEMIFNMKIDLESACTDAKNYKLQLSENAKLHEELKQNYESLLMLCSVEVKEENVRVEIWNEINEVLNACETGERIILLGDMNGWVGTQRESSAIVLGRFGDDRVDENCNEL